MPTLKTNLNAGHRVLLFASYCGNDNPGCTDRLPCLACLAMSNVYALQSDAEALYAGQLGVPDTSESVDSIVANRVREAFETNDTAAQYIREDGQGGMAGIIHRMARDIERLRSKCGEPPHRPDRWEDEEEALWDAEEDLEILKLQGGSVQ